MKDRKSLEDYFEASKINSALYAVIVLVIFLSLYFVIVQYLAYKGVASNRIKAYVVVNDVQQFTDGVHPVLTIDVQTRLESKIRLDFEADRTYSFANDDYAKEYTKLVVLPKEMLGKEMELRVSAEDKAGNILMKTVDLKTRDAGWTAEGSKKEEEVKFEVKDEVKFQFKPENNT